MTREKVMDWVGAKMGAIMDSPFPKDFDTIALRCARNHKWFGILLYVKAKSLCKDSSEFFLTIEGQGDENSLAGDDQATQICRMRNLEKSAGTEKQRQVLNDAKIAILNLKCPPDLSTIFRSQYPWVLPAFHMNKVHWNTIILSEVDDEKVLFKMLELSFDQVE